MPSPIPLSPDHAGPYWRPKAEPTGFDLTASLAVRKAAQERGVQELVIRTLKQMKPTPEQREKITPILQASRGRERVAMEIAA